MSVVSMKQLLEAGVHFGHQTRRWNPKMAQYIFTERNGIYIIDLQKTVEEARKRRISLCATSAASGENVLFVGTKKQAAGGHQARKPTRCGHVLRQRQLAGRHADQLQDHPQQQCDRLNQLNNMEKSGEFDLLPKKEVIGLKQRERQAGEQPGRHQGNDEDCRGAMFIVDPSKEHIAVAEARKLGIPIVAHRGYQLRSGRGGLCDPRQRRRHPCRQADRGQRWQTPSSRRARASSWKLSDENVAAAEEAAEAVDTTPRAPQKRASKTAEEITAE